MVGRNSGIVRVFVPYFFIHLFTKFTKYCIEITLL